MGNSRFPTSAPEEAVKKREVQVAKERSSLGKICTGGTTMTSRRIAASEKRIKMFISTETVKR